jgi:hypothetical protein
MKKVILEMKKVGCRRVEAAVPAASHCLCFDKKLLEGCVDGFGGWADVSACYLHGTKAE